MAYCLLYGLDAVRIDRERALALLLQCSSSGHLAARSLASGLGNGAGMKEYPVAPVGGPLGAVGVSGPITPDAYEQHWAERLRRADMAIRGDTQNGDRRFCSSPFPHTHTHTHTRARVSCRFP
jgi:hypothetical protein